MSLSEVTIDIPVEHEKNVFGQFDAYARKIERSFHITLIVRDGVVKLLGEQEQADKARRVLTQLVELSRRGNVITEQNVDYAISLVFENQEDELVEIDKDLICYTLQGKPVRPKTLGQKSYVDAIRGGMVTFGLGPAGTGKTYLAIAMAVTAFNEPHFACRARRVMVDIDPNEIAKLHMEFAKTIVCDAGAFVSALCRRAAGATAMLSRLPSSSTVDSTA